LPGRGALIWHPGPNGNGTAAVRLAAGYDTSTLRAGVAVVVSSADGSTKRLAVTTRRTTSTGEAAATAARLAQGMRVVLLQTDPATGQVLVIVAG